MPGLSPAAAIGSSRCCGVFSSTPPRQILRFGPTSIAMAALLRNGHLVSVGAIAFEAWQQRCSAFDLGVCRVECVAGQQVGGFNTDAFGHNFALVGFSCTRVGGQ